MMKETAVKQREIHLGLDELGTQWLEESLTKQGICPRAAMYLASNPHMIRLREGNVDAVKGSEYACPMYNRLISAQGTVLTINTSNLEKAINEAVDADEIDDLTGQNSTVWQINIAPVTSPKVLRFSQLDLGTQRRLGLLDRTNPYSSSHPMCEHLRSSLLYD